MRDVGVEPGVWFGGWVWIETLPAVVMEYERSLTCSGNKIPFELGCTDDARMRLNWQSFAQFFDPYSVHSTGIITNG